MLHNEDLSKRVIALVGLVCGQQKSKFFAEYLCALAGGQPARLISASFRVKDLARHHLDHRFEFTCESGNVTRGHIYQSEGMSRLWGHDCFKLNACNFCDDITAEVADITFGDAVAEPYSYGNEGANFVIVRSGLMRDMLVSGSSAGGIHLDHVPLQVIVERQKGIALLKRDDLQHRLHLARDKSTAAYIPVKRFPPGERFISSLNRDMEMRDRMREVSRHVYAENRYQPGIVLEMERALKSVLAEFERNNLSYRLLHGVVSSLVSIKNRIIVLTRKVRALY